MVIFQVARILIPSGLKGYYMGSDWDATPYKSFRLWCDVDIWGTYLSTWQQEWLTEYIGKPSLVYAYNLIETWNVASWWRM